MMNQESANAFAQFLDWEKTTRDIIDFKKAYVDMADDLIAGLVLSALIYWYLPDKQGKSKLRVFKNGFHWIARQRGEWWDEIRITPKQADRALSILEGKGIIVKAYYLFNGARVSHIRIDPENFMRIWNEVTQIRLETGDLPKVKPGINESASPITETTTETTTETEELTEGPDYLDHVFGFQVGREGIADPSADDDQHVHYSDPFVDAYHQITGWKPNQIQRSAIEALSLDSDADPQFWKTVVREWLNCGWRKTNVKMMLEYYRRREVPGDLNRGGEQRRSGPVAPSWVNEDWSDHAELPDFIK